MVNLFRKIYPFHRPKHHTLSGNMVCLIGQPDVPRWQERSAVPAKKPLDASALGDGSQK
jgi:hypothetical protein